MTEMTRREFIRDSFVLFADISFDLDKKPIYKIRVNVPQYILDLYEDRIKRGSFLVCTGKPKTPTPLGKFKIIGKADWENNFAGTWLRFLGGKSNNYGIHGYPLDWPLGYSLSKGSVRMNAEDAQSIKEKIPLGTEVDLFYDTIELDASKGTITLYADIYKKGTNSRKNITDKLHLLPEIVNQRRLKDFLITSEERTGRYIGIISELYNKFIKPQPDGTVNMNILQEHPEIFDYLEGLDKNKTTITSISDLL